MIQPLHPVAGSDHAPRLAIAVAGVHCLCRSEHARSLRKIYDSGTWAFDALHQQPDATTIPGRRPLVRATLDGVPVLVKRLFHGGMLRHLTGDRFLTPRRFRNHLAAADYLSSHAVATPETLFASWRRLRGTVRGEIGIRFIPGAVDASASLFADPRRLPDDWRQRVSAVGELLARLHGLRVLHGDLNLRNFLFLPDGGLAILDLDKALCHSYTLFPWQRTRNRRRLERSIRKQGARAPAQAVASLIGELRSSYEAAVA